MATLKQLLGALCIVPFVYAQNCSTNTTATVTETIYLVPAQSMATTTVTRVVTSILIVTTNAQSIQSTLQESTTRTVSPAYPVKLAGSYIKTGSHGWNRTSSAEARVTASAHATVNRNTTSSTTVLFANTSTTTSAVATQTSTSSCGVVGNFTLNWDDEPIFTPTDPTSAPYTPVFNPYAYAPPPSELYLPHSPPHLALFLPNASTTDIGSPSAAGARPGELGAGPRANNPYFWFDATSAYFGCDDAGPSNCDVSLRGFTWDNNTQAEVQTAELDLTLYPCSKRPCQLQFASLGMGFVGLSGLQIQASVKGQARVFFIDDLDMAWADDSCEAGRVRGMTRKV